MGCSGLLLNLGVKALLQQSRLSLLCTMLLVVTYFFYCLAGLCDSVPRTLYDHSNNKLLLDRDYDHDTAVDGIIGHNNNINNNIRVLFDKLRAPSPRLRGAHGENLRRNRTDAVITHSAQDAADAQVDAAAAAAGGRQADHQGGPPRPPSSVMPVANTFGSKKFPQAIIIGVKKGGTRALLEFLRIHPDVRAVGAEPHFFDRFYDKGLEWYRNLMPRTLEGQITMEKTPSYFVTRETPQRVSTLNPRTKLIVVVRDPVTRAVSDYTQTLSKNPGLPSFQSLALKNSSSSSPSPPADDLDFLHDGPVDAAWSAVRIGLYAKHLENWLRHFPLSHFLFVSGERLVSDPAGEMGRVQDFLGLKRVVSDKHFYFNQTKGFPCLKKPEGSSRPRCLGKSKGRPHPQIPAHVLQRLRDFYRPYNLRFYQMSGHDFGWD